MVTVSWAPDSTELVVAGTIGNDNGLWIINRDGTDLRRIVDRGVEVGGDVDRGQVPSWSATGGIAFVGQSVPGRADPGFLEVDRPAIYVVAPDGSGLRAVTPPGETTGEDSDVENTGPSWSPDGRRIVYEHSGELRIITVATRTEQRLRQAGGYSPAWSPDGRLIAFIGDAPLRGAAVERGNESGVQVIAVRGGPAREVRVPRLLGSLDSLDWRSG